MSAQQVVLVRHAETEWSLSGQHTGLTDLPLTQAGRRTAAGLAGRLAGWSFDLVLTSPLVRARETAELAGLGERALERDVLVEWDYGAYEGLTSAQIYAERPDWNLWRDGCPDGESPAQVGARADRAIEEIRSHGGTVAVFSHGHMLRVIGARWIGLGPERGGSLGLSTAAVCVLSSEHEAPVIGRWNDAGIASEV